MTRITAADVRKFLLGRYAEEFSARELEAGDVADDFDLLTEGVVDSFGILEMLGAMEAELGVTIDYESLDPDDLTVMGRLCNFVAHQSGAEEGS